ncbi:MAG: ParB/RepB/Spo0J family partition protein [Methylococcaceae bacterium]|nr:ParB/RepB/Spo0J family partition protein [Methylococcaceae bacterium]
MSVKKRGLGRGLDALLGGVKAEEIAGGAPVDRDRLRSLPIDLLQSGRFQPRKDFDKDRLQELADSISAQGVVQPIVVRAVGDQRYEIIAGERRWRAAQLAGLHEIPVVVREVTDQAALAIALIENIQREDLNPLEESEAMRRLQEEFTMTHQQIADAVGKSRATVTNLLRLHELHPEVKTLLQHREIEMGHARAILAVALELQPEVARKVAAGRLSVRETENLIRRLQQDKKRAISPVNDPDITRLEVQVAERLGAKVAIQHTKQGAGKLVISYDNLDHLQGVLDRLR